MEKQETKEIEYNLEKNLYFVSLAKDIFVCLMNNSKLQHMRLTYENNMRLATDLVKQAIEEFK